jgi:hypothetical protein
MSGSALFGAENGDFFFSLTAFIIALNFIEAVMKCASGPLSAQEDGFVGS